MTRARSTVPRPRSVLGLLMFLLLPLLLLMTRTPQFVTQQEAARRLGIHDRTIRNWISQGLVTGYRLPGGRAIRVDYDEIVAMLKVVPTVRAGRNPFGPKARIVTVNAVENNAVETIGEVAQ